MDRVEVVSYMNGALMRNMHGSISRMDCIMMVRVLYNTKGVNISPDNLFQAVRRSSVEMIEKYKTGLWNTLCKMYNLHVMTGVSLNFNNISGDQILKYK